MPYLAPKDCLTFPNATSYVLGPGLYHPGGLCRPVDLAASEKKETFPAEAHEDMGFVTTFITASLAITGAAAFPNNFPSLTLGQRSSIPKRGAAYNDVSAMQALASSNSGSISWAYNWDSNK